jgi:beta-phosphoglucomutase
VRAVIFDFDGTLVDTMPIHFEAYRRVFDEMGLELTRADFFDNIGGKAPETIPRFLRGRAAPLTVQEIHARKRATLDVLLESVEIPVLATAALLPWLHGLVPIAIASSGSRPGIEKILARLGWEKYFRAVICGEDVPNGKPAPDLFLRAAQEIECAPEGCLVFEDTSDGVEAARAAGMHVVDVRATVAGAK